MRIVWLSFIFLFFFSRFQYGYAQIQNIREKQDSVSISNSTQQIKQKDIKKGLLSNALEALSGQSAGVNVTTNGADRLAMLNSVRVRGTTSIMGGNDPLVIIDGVTSDIATLSTIYPADIESFNILKNASETAMYGSRGASGVIEVKTKKGTGKGFEISYDGNYGFESMYKHLKMLDAEKYISTGEALGLHYNNGGYNTNFHDVITRTGLLHQHHLAFSGGSVNSNYRASFGFMDHKTIVKVNDYRNLVVKLDATQKAFNGKLTGDFGVYGSSSKIHDIFDTRMLFYSTAAQNPTYPAGPDANGNWVKNSAASHINHPGILLDEKNDSKESNFNTHLRLTYQILDNLKLSAFGSYSFYSTEKAQFCPTWVWAQGNVYRGEFKGEDYFAHLSLGYHNIFGKSHFNANISGEYLKQTKTGFWMQAKGITTNDFSYNNIGATSSRPFGSSGSSYESPSLLSFMGNATYSFMDKYHVTATVRGDGSSMVGDSHTFGIFPSLSANWNLKKEAFFSNIDFLTLLKLRVGYGLSGNLGGITSYTTLNTVKENGIVSVNGAPTVTMGSMKNTNPDLKWETRATFNVGLDWGMWNNRLMLTTEFYYSKTSDMLYAYDVPVPTFAFDKLMANIGSMSNQGFELGVSVIPIQKKDMEMDINLNLSYQKNKLISLSGEYNGMQMSASDITPIGSLYGAGQNGGNNNVVYQIVGQPLGVFYLPHCKGLVKNDMGGYSYDIEDLNKDGHVDLSDGGDRYIAGQATPKLTLGSNISIRYKALDVSIQINGAFGHKIFNGTGLAYNNMSIFPDYNVMKGAPEKNIIDQNVSDYWLENGDYINIEHLTMGYNVPLKSKSVKSLRLSASINNLATITGYGGLTPMVNSYVVSNTLGIDDKRTYPLYRTFSLGVSVQF
ncbi:MAG: SusC/RagA family TonB-linked outer membrane protein [Bacteroidaceae bacterium]|nr:SusC/RagA family TonB-linked outer membrane protein [Bacteroidaceae bacterium]